MDHLIEVASSVGTPLGLAGMALVVLLGVFKAILSLKIFPKLSKSLGSQLLNKIVDRLFVLALVAVLLGFLGYISPLVGKYFSTSKQVSTTGSCSPVIQDATGPTTITCSNIPQVQLDKINRILESQTTNQAITIRLIKLLEQQTGTDESNISSAVAFAEKYRDVSARADQIAAYDEQAANAAKRALTKGDLERASAYVDAVKSLKVDHIIKLNDGYFVIGTQQNNTFDPVLAYQGKFLTNLPISNGESLLYEDNFGVQKLGEWQFLLFDDSLGGTACPANWVLLAVNGSEVDAYSFGNCNESIDWAKNGESLVLTVAAVERNGEIADEDQEQRLELRLNGGNITAKLNGKQLQSKTLR